MASQHGSDTIELAGIPAVNGDHVLKSQSKSLVSLDWRYQKQQNKQQTDRPGPVPAQERRADVETGLESSTQLRTEAPTAQQTILTTSQPGPQDRPSDLALNYWLCQYDDKGVRLFRRSFRNRVMRAARWMKWFAVVQLGYALITLARLIDLIFPVNRLDTCTSVCVVSLVPPLYWLMVVAFFILAIKFRAPFRESTLMGVSLSHVFILLFLAGFALSLAGTLALETITRRDFRMGSTIHVLSVVFVVVYAGTVVVLLLYWHTAKARPMLPARFWETKD